MPTVARCCFPLYVCPGYSVSYDADKHSILWWWGLWFLLGCSTEVVLFVEKKGSSIATYYGAVISYPIANRSVLKSGSSMISCTMGMLPRRWAGVTIGGSHMSPGQRLAKLVPPALLHEAQDRHVYQVVAVGVH